MMVQRQKLVASADHEDSSKRLEKDFGEEFGTRLCINPNLPPNTDFSGGQNMETPNSFKCGPTPTTPFGLSHLHFPNNITITNFSQINASINPATNNNTINSISNTTNIINTINTSVPGVQNTSYSGVPEATTDDLLNFMPKTPLVPGQGMQFRNFSYNFANSQQQKTQQQSQLQQQQSQVQSSSMFKPSMDVSFENPKIERQYSANSTEKMENKNMNLPGLSIAQPQNVSPPNLALDIRLKQEAQHKEPAKKKEKTKLKRGRSKSAIAGSRTAVKDESRWKSWTREEEVFLVGAVMDRFFKRGSLSSTRADDLTSDDSWTVIKNYYETAWRNYHRRTGICIPTERPANALSRHYKVMKARISQADISGDATEDFRTYFDEWENIYNIDNCLVAELVKNRSPLSKKVNLARIKKDETKLKEFRKRKVRLSIRKESPGDRLRRSSVRSVGSHTGSSIASESFPIREEETVHEEYV